MVALCMAAAPASCSRQPMLVGVDVALRVFEFELRELGCYSLAEAVAWVLVGARGLKSGLVYVVYCCLLQVAAQCCSVRWVQLAVWVVLWLEWSLIHRLGAMSMLGYGRVTARMLCFQHPGQGTFAPTCGCGFGLHKRS
jgi:hypothetical protein